MDPGLLLHIFCPRDIRWFSLLHFLLFLFILIVITVLMIAINIFVLVKLFDLQCCCTALLFVTAGYNMTLTKVQPSPITCARWSVYCFMSAGVISPSGGSIRDDPDRSAAPARFSSCSHPVILN